MRYALKRVLGFVLLLTLSFAGLNSRGEGSPTALADELMLKGQPAQAVNILLTARETNATDLEILRRLSSAWLQVGDGEKTPSAKIAAYQKSVAEAEAIIFTHPQSPVGYVSRASALGQLCPLVPTRTGGRYVKRVREDSLLAISLAEKDPLSAALAYYILGTLNSEVSDMSYIARKLGGFDWASKTEAQNCLARAIELEPESIQFRLKYAKILEANGFRKEAWAQWQTARRLPVRYPGDEARLAEVEANLARF